MSHDTILISAVFKIKGGNVFQFIRIGLVHITKGASNYDIRFKNIYEGVPVGMILIKFWQSLVYACNLQNCWSMPFSFRSREYNDFAVKAFSCKIFHNMTPLSLTTFITDTEVKNLFGYLQT